MPRRKTPLVNNEIYHVYNRSNGKIEIFKHFKYYDRFLKLADFYRFSETAVRFSYFNRLDKKKRNEFMDTLYLSKRQVEIYAFALMPNHYHFLIKQLEANGISKFISKTQNAFSKYFNLKEDRTGNLFQSSFKAKRIEDEQQLIHVSRYIHLNPLTSYVLENNSDLKTYFWTSFTDYLSEKPRKLVYTEFIFNMFKNKEEFVDYNFDRVDYQRQLKFIEHMLLE